MNAFGTHLAQLRINAQLTNRTLAERARVPYTLIAGLQSGKRSIGESNARRIGAALDLQGIALRDFVYAALNGAVGKVLEEFRAYPAEIINLVAAKLKSCGIEAANVETCLPLPAFDDGNNPDAELRLKDGRSAFVTVKVETR